MSKDGLPRRLFLKGVASSPAALPLAGGFYDFARAIDSGRDDRVAASNENLAVETGLNEMHHEWLPEEAWFSRAIVGTFGVKLGMTVANPEKNAFKTRDVAHMYGLAVSKIGTLAAKGLYETIQDNHDLAERYLGAAGQEATELAMGAFYNLLLPEFAELATDYQLYTGMILEKINGRTEMELGTFDWESSPKINTDEEAFEEGRSSHLEAWEQRIGLLEEHLVKLIATDAGAVTGMAPLGTTYPAAEKLRDARVATIHKLWEQLEWAREIKSEKEKRYAMFDTDHPENIRIEAEEKDSIRARIDERVNKYMSGSRGKANADSAAGGNVAGLLVGAGDLPNVVFAINNIMAGRPDKIITQNLVGLLIASRAVKDIYHDFLNHANLGVYTQLFDEYFANAYSETQKGLKQSLTKSRARNISYLGAKPQGREIAQAIQDLQNKRERGAIDEIDKVELRLLEKINILPAGIISLIDIPGIFARQKAFITGYLSHQSEAQTSDDIFMHDFVGEGGLFNSELLGLLNNSDISDPEALLEQKLSKFAAARRVQVESDLAANMSDIMKYAEEFQTHIANLRNIPEVAQLLERIGNVHINVKLPEPEELIKNVIDIHAKRRTGENTELSEGELFSLLSVITPKEMSGAITRAIGYLREGASRNVVPHQQRHRQFWRHNAAETFLALGVQLPTGRSVEQVLEFDLYPFILNGVQDPLTRFYTEMGVNNTVGMAASGWADNVLLSLVTTKTNSALIKRNLGSALQDNTLLSAYIDHSTPIFGQIVGETGGMGSNLGNGPTVPESITMGRRGDDGYLVVDVFPRSLGASAKNPLAYKFMTKTAFGVNAIQIGALEAARRMGMWSVDTQDASNGHAVPAGRELTRRAFWKFVLGQ